ncbi:MAG TPA: DUF6377 domain-containing protein [Bacteroidales bacterium]|nr:MAG: hypothetical protein BWX62_00098 [Bacteroidetes bacterium ADurb.Bin037]HPV87671.1 DUF6377 domain-containing protein [Bacteroidales bacterium]HPW77937.1 DUF6377 domain-containing protein [Bacteroidales bacterium]HQB55395.1 DUF6377 domain-containing protein [Bacteroidales bacterium]
MKRHCLTAICLVFSALLLQGESRESLTGFLDRLDKQLELRSTYEQNRLQRINALKSVLQYQDLSPEQRYSFYLQIIDEYKAYNFDSTMYYIDISADLAKKFNNLYRDKSQIRRGLLFATSGNFFESGDILYNEIDSLQLDPSLLPEYYSALQRLAAELAEYSTDPAIKHSSQERTSYYRDKILELLDPQSDEYIYYKFQEAYEQGDLERADSLSAILVSRHQESSHAYAIYAYHRSTVFQNRGEVDSQMEWLVRSALADIQSAVKDHASLTRLATVLFETGGNIDRAFRYIDISLADALFYNAKLRPWQVAAVLPQIEKNYQEKQVAQARRVKVFLISISALVLILIVAIGYLVKQTRKTIQAHKSLRGINKRIVAQNKELNLVNEQLQQLNNEIAKSNQVKEEYIGLFLAILSDNLDKMKEFRAYVKRSIRYGKVQELTDELNNIEWADQEIANFYRTFDSAFLELYPTFVEDFNALLVPGEQIVLKKGELLNTELRIFALIRLGIKDSGRIASLLRYSVNTIYNYRAKIKNVALGSRDDFENRVSSL